MGTMVRVCNIGMGGVFESGNKGLRVCNLGMVEYLIVGTQVRVCNVGMGG